MGEPLQRLKILEVSDTLRVEITADLVHPIIGRGTPRRELDVGGRTWPAERYGIEAGDAPTVEMFVDVEDVGTSSTSFA
ncbi:MAG: hypothetical protein ACR2MB_01375 [Acidimicrobiales bacterium]